MYIDLCGGELSHSIEHPTRQGERLFLIFDFTHNFNNIYYNFVNKWRMRLPPLHGFQDILGETRVASFNRSKHLYAIEKDKTWKIAFAWKKASLNISGIAHISLHHALSK